MKISFLLIASALFLFSCSKSDDLGRDPDPSGLTSFTVSVIERIPNRAIIEWTPSLDIVGGAIVKYNVSLDGQIIHSGLVQTRDTLRNLSGDVLYAGKVTAYTEADSIVSEFTLQKVNGILIMGIDANQNNKSAVEAFDIYSNAKLWSTETGSGNTYFFGQPAVSNDTVFMTKPRTLDFSVFALNVKTGAILWKGVPSSGNNEIFGITYSQGKLFATLNGKVICLNAATGQVIWTYQSPTSYFDSPVSVENGKVYAGTYNGGGSELYALNVLNGTVAWRFTYSGGFAGRVARSGSALFFTTISTMYSVREADGTLIWSRTDDGVFRAGHSPVLFNNTVITGGNQFRGFFALDQQTGTILWNFRNGVSSYAPTVGNGNLYFTQTYSAGNKLTVINASTGNQLWQKDNTDGSRLIFANNRVYAYQKGLSAYIAALDANTGERLVAIASGSDIDDAEYVVVINSVPYYQTGNPNYR